MADDQELYVGQKAFINKNGKILVLIDPDKGLDFPGGKIQIGERDVVLALKREVKEETTLEIEVGEPFYTWMFEFGSAHRNAGKLVYLVGFGCEYLSGEIEISDEHSHFEWVDKDTYTKFHENSDYYKALEHYFNTVSKD